MKITLPRVIAAIVFTMATASTATADNYQCQDAGGCNATANNDGKLKKVRFRPGDVVDTESGWVVRPTDGWKKLKKSKRTRQGV